MRPEYQEHHKSTGLDASTMPTPPQTTERQQCSAPGEKASLVQGCACQVAPDCGQSLCAASPAIARGLPAGLSAGFLIFPVSVTSCLGMWLNLQ